MTNHIDKLKKILTHPVAKKLACVYTASRAA